MVHGCIDGYSRRIMYLSCSGNNRADTVLHVFTHAVHRWGLLVECVLTEVGRTWMLHHTCCSIHLEDREEEVSLPDVVFIIKELKGCGVMFSQAAQHYSTISSISWRTTPFLMWTMKYTCSVCITCLCSESTMLYRCLLVPGIITLCCLWETSPPFNYGLLVCPDRVWSKIYN